MTPAETVERLRLAWSAYRHADDEVARIKSYTHRTTSMRADLRRHESARAANARTIEELLK